MKPNLIVFHSRNGHSRTVAGELGRYIEADFEEIMTINQKRGFLSYLSDAWSALTRKPASIVAPKHHARRYPMVIIGGPNWAGNISAPILSWLDKEGTQLGFYAAWITKGGTSATSAIKQLEDEVGHPPAAVLILTNHEISSGKYKGKVAEFAEQLLQLNLR